MLNKQRKKYPRLTNHLHSEKFSLFNFMLIIEFKCNKSITVTHQLNDEVHSTLYVYYTAERITSFTYLEPKKELVSRSF